MKTKLQIITESLIKLTEASKEPDTKGMKPEEIHQLVLSGQIKPRTADHHLALQAHLTQLYGPHDPDAMTFPEGHPAIPIYGRFDPRYNPYKSPAAIQRGKETSDQMSIGIHGLAHGEAYRHKQAALDAGKSPEEAERIYKAAYAKAYDYWSK